MLLNTLSIIEMILQEKFPNKSEEFSDVLEFFKHYKSGMWLYPGILKRKYKFDLPEVYAFLTELEKQGVLQSYYELYCSCCQKSIGRVQLFSELPDTFSCDLCHNELPALENAILIYKVVRDD